MSCNVNIIENTLQRNLRTNSTREIFLEHLEAQILKNLMLDANHGGASMSSIYALVYQYITGSFSKMFIKSIKTCCPYADNIQKCFVLEVNFIIFLYSPVNFIIGKVCGDKNFNSMKSLSLTQNLVAHRQN